VGLKWSRAQHDASIRALRQASAEFDDMINKEMVTLEVPIRQAMVAYSDMQKNRISHDMVNAMQAKVAGSQLRMGFLGDFQNYYQYQTITGFVHWRSGEFIPPSLAIEDAKQDAQLLMDEASQRIRRNFMARLRRRS
jgi:hypothetical protein